jgi:hypothetical protein
MLGVLYSSFPRRKEVCECPCPGSVSSPPRALVTSDVTSGTGNEWTDGHTRTCPPPANKSKDPYHACSAHQRMMLLNSMGSLPACARGGRLCDSLGGSHLRSPAKVAKTRLQLCGHRLLPPCNGSSKVVTTTTSEILLVELATADARASLELGVTRQRDRQDICVVDVAAGSEAEAAGIRPGMVLKAISDPVRRNEVSSILNCSIRDLDRLAAEAPSIEWPAAAMLGVGCVATQG